MTTTSPTIERVFPDIFYEDPEPVEDGMQQDPTISYLSYTFRHRLGGRRDVFVSGGGFIFFNPDNGNERVAPDYFIVIGVDPDVIMQFPNYLIWEAGKPPDLVIEVASPSTASNDLGHKRDLYAELGITEYWRLDPTGGELYGDPLVGERLVNGEYIRYDLNVEPGGSIWSRSEVLHLDFYWDGEQFDIRDPLTGKTVNPAEFERQARLESEAQVESERQARLESEAQAEFERQARLESEAQVRRLMEENERLRRQQLER